MKAVVLVSGGVDSTVLAYRVRRDYTDDLELLHLNRSERHVEAAAKTATKLDVPLGVMDMPVHDLPFNRNAVILNVGIGVALQRDADAVFCGIHAGDSPDRRSPFIDSVNDLQMIAAAGIRPPEFTVEAPFIFYTPAEVIEVGVEVGVPWEDTWSCVGDDSSFGDIHCGRCDPCVERAHAFYLAQVVDPVPYEDPEFWTEQV